MQELKVQSGEQNPKQPLHPIIEKYGNVALPTGIYNGQLVVQGNLGRLLRWCISPIAK